MTDFYTYSKNTGLGAASIKYCGKKIKFTKNGTYPKNTNEYIWTKIKIKFHYPTIYNPTILTQFPYS